MLTDGYLQLYNRLASTIPADRLIHDDLRTLAFGTDASFYRLIPRLVVKVENEDDVACVLRACRELHLPLTFRAAGTSLSGQAISDSVLVMLGPSWNKFTIEHHGERIRLQPGVIGGHANVYLSPYGKKIGPDPASINACMIGGIAANNASGMCCGTAQNSYNTLASMRIVFADGSVLDTRDEASTMRFKQSHNEMLARISALSQRVRSNTPLAERIRRKFKMKNTTGYSLNALVDFDDPIDVIQHLMIGSEGTLGFISEITYNTVPEHPHKATALILYPDIETACLAVTLLKDCNVSAVELMDRASLRSVQDKKAMPEYLKTLHDGVAALLVETRAADKDTLQHQIADIEEAIRALPVVRPIAFTSEPIETARLWNIRKGLFPSVGAMRETGTTVIIEDVAFPVPRLAEATLELQSLFKKLGYNEAIIFGHALEGNLHFVFAQSFNARSEVDRYAAFMDDLAEMVVKKYDGSLKAEHGTGRNMAPYVELEWGAQAYSLMKEIKSIFDPENLLNPGVILNLDKQIHIKNLKPLPSAHPLVDKCIECGFCEVHCPSKNLTITPRQRIVAFREISRLIAERSDGTRLASLRHQFQYQGDHTCATDGLCATSCPVEIDTGKLIKELRFLHHSPFENRVADIVAEHFSLVSGAIRFGLNVADAMHRVLGTSTMDVLSRFLRRVSHNNLPQWTAAMPKGADRIIRQNLPTRAEQPVVYFPTCINRTLGCTTGTNEPSLTTLIHRLLNIAGFTVIYPDSLGTLCCGMAFASKGFVRQGDRKARELEAALATASNNGALPILVDMSPCALRMKETCSSSLRIFEQVEFVKAFLLDRLPITKNKDTIAIHHTCSARKMGLEAGLMQLAQRCADNIVVPDGIGCCGWAGDRGFFQPELTQSALRGLRAGLPSNCMEGYSTSRTCEIGLSLQSGIAYRSTFHLISDCIAHQE
jgi:D-lactate dehydrogenase